MVQRYKFIVSEDADEDLVRINNTLSENSSTVFSEKIFAKYEYIAMMPKMYQRIYYKKNTHTDYRRVVFKKYIIIYKIQKNQITILRIVSEKEDYLKSKNFKPT